MLGLVAIFPLLAGLLRAKDSEPPACFSSEELQRLGLFSDIGEDPSPARICEDLHQDFDSCANSISLEHSYYTMSSRLAANYTANLQSLIKAAPPLARKARALRKQLLSASTGDVDPHRALKELRRNLKAFGNETEFAAQVKDVLEDSACLEAQKSLLLTTLCLTTARGIAQPFFDISGSKIFKVSRPLPEILLASCDANLNITCLVTDLMASLSPLSGEDFSNHREFQACKHFRAYKDCEAKGKPCPEEQDRVFEAFFKPNSALITHSLLPLQQDPYAEEFTFQVSEAGLPIQDYLFAGAAKMMALASIFVVLAN